MQSSFSIVVLSIFSAFFGVQAAPSSQINRRSYGSTPSYSHEQPKAYAPKVEAYHPKQVYTPKVESYQPKQEVYTPKVEAYQPKQEVYIPKVEAYQLKKEVYQPEPVKQSYTPKPYVTEKPTYVKSHSYAY
ncbi:hypothetical protein DSO57_1010242 [Entomophthora muscae]|uniref:Uncharacterized protein n=1 Tax=Entomophthora muscae TaxID=34485 RepID=A0ACC2RXI2_9FUNG|nr:hypothetical protein DSO57_1010242 [Entomophthora muscae]